MMAMRWTVPALAGVVALVVSGCSDDESTSRTLPDVPDAAFVETRVLELGRGIVAPYRIVQDPTQPDSLFIITGRGETFPEARLHRVDIETLEDRVDPIVLGANAADLEILGDDVVVAVRGSEKLVLVDAAGWAVTHELSLGFPPVALARTAPDEVVVASATTKEVVWVRQSGAELQVVSRIGSQGFANTVLADPDTGRVYVVEPQRGVEVLGLGTRLRRALIELPGEPSRGATFWRGYLVVSNRDGYLHFIDEDSQTVTTLDVADALGLDRAVLAVRGIDSGDVVVIDDDLLLLVNGRQDSVLFAATVGGDVPVRAMARLPGGAFGMYDAARRSILISQPSLNAVTRVDLPLEIPVGSHLKGRRVVTGAEILSSRVLTGSQWMLGVLDSDGVAYVLDADGNVISTLTAPVDEVWRMPLITAPQGGVGVIARTPTGAEFLRIMDQSGALIARWPVRISAVFSGVQSNGTALLISRVNRRVQTLDLASGTSEVLTMQRDRPRVAAAFAAGSWVVAHDTTPDIGVTLIRANQEQQFEPFDDWFSAMTSVDADTVLGVSFNGALTLIDAGGRIAKTVRSALFSVSDVGLAGDAVAWVVSENLGIAHRVNVPDLDIDARYRRDGLRYMTGGAGPADCVAVGVRSVAFLESAP